MINLIIFSKNRPMQCQATIDSLPLGFFDNVDVLYKADAEYEEGYALLKQRKPEVHFVEQTDFKENLLSLFKYEWTCLAADDDIFIEHIDKDIVNLIVNDVVCFSLRLGLNIDYCYSNDKPNKIKEYKETGDFIMFNWREQELDFAYPLSVISHIFRTEQIKDLSSRDEYANPNIYEGVLQKYLNELQPHMVAYRKSRVFGVPANRVNDTNPNRNGLTHSYTTEELNEMYLKGKTIDVARHFKINACQQEIEYAFT